MRVTIPETTLIYVGIPAAVTAVIAGVTMLTSKGRVRPAQYRLDQPWEHAPLLWTAADEVAGFGAAHGHSGHGDHVEIGGWASGRY